LIRRHPHVFGEAEATDAGAVLRNWEQIKREEKATAKMASAGLLDEVSRSMPAMMEARKLGSQAAKVGFDWPDTGGLVKKLREEMAELEAELPEPSAALEEELGDLLFTVVHLARHLKADPEMALRGANAKFRRRFGHMEQVAGGSEELAKLSAESLEELWRGAKKETIAR
jgi:XTP/dITP diphosphohydrolase/ATP diphosphatase